MKWFYVVGNKPVGPVERAELEALITAGTISPATLVTQEGMYDWFPYRDLKKTTQLLFTEGVKSAMTHEEPK